MPISAAFVCIIAVALALSACASRHKAEGSGNSPAYAAGYTDGCASGSARAEGAIGGDTRDANLFKTSNDYRAGWRAGYASCAWTRRSNPFDNPFGKPPGT
jgi:hypothetical protein